MTAINAINSSKNKQQNGDRSKLDIADLSLKLISIEEQRRSRRRRTVSCAQHVRLIVNLRVYLANCERTKLNGQNT